MHNRDKYNKSGCLDLTAYYAIRNVEREEQLLKRRTRRRRTQRQPIKIPQVASIR